MLNELIVDNFAGGGGASLGISLALGRSPSIAINHDAAAIAMHAANHPDTKHYTEDVWKVSPQGVTGGRPVGLLWASPDCKHFSRAKGAKPVEKKIRSLAWVVVKWAAQSRPRLIILENVREFEDWGPLIPRWKCSDCDWKGTEGQAKLARRRRMCPRCDSKALKETPDQVPDPNRKGLTFRRFTGRLRNMGYKIEHKVLDAADFGAPTHRKRLFLIARRDGQHIVWPAPTHGDPKKIGKDLFTQQLKPWRPAAECIDWTLPCPSIFERKRPLAEATMRRIAMGIKRYVLESTRPFIVRTSFKNAKTCVHPPEEPFRTFTSQEDQAMVTPYLVRCNHGGEDNWQRSRSVEDPLFTVTQSHGEALITPILAGVGGPEYSGKPREAGKPFGTVTTENHTGLVAAFLSKYHGQRGPEDQESRCHRPDEPIRVLDTQNRYGLVAANLVHMNHGGKQDSGLDESMRTVVAGGLHAALVYSFLVKYFGTAIGTTLENPMPTATVKDRFGLVTVTINGETYVIVDIGMRMLTPRELARGQGFPDSYILTGTKSSQVARIGNSVSPVMAEALVRANFAAPARPAEKAA